MRAADARARHQFQSQNASEDQMRRCNRCNGCGQVEGSGRKERPWNRFESLPVHQAVEKMMGMHRPHACPDCNGTGLRRDSAA